MELQMKRVSSLGLTLALAMAVVVPTPAVRAAAPNSWTTTGALPAWVAYPQVVTLADGRILFVGGGGSPFSAGDILAVPLVYTPATGTWAATSSPPWAPAVAEGLFAVALTDGRVLIGGPSMTAGDHAANAWFYQPSAPNGGSWSEAPAIPSAQVYAAAGRLGDGRVVVAGGGYASAAVYIFDPVANAWTTKNPLPYPMAGGLMVTLKDGRVLLLGGYAYGSTNQAFYVYNTSLDTWTLGPITAGGYGQAAAVLADGRVLIAGGGSNTLGPSANAILFDPASFTYKLLPSMSTARAGLALVALKNGLVLAAGGLGAGTGPLRSSELFDPASNRWVPGPSMSAYHVGPGAALLADGQVLVAGGTGQSYVSELYTPGDVVGPAIGAPLASLRSGTTCSCSSVPVRLAWTAVDNGGSGLGSYDVARSTNGGAYSSIASAITSTYLNTTLAVGSSYVFRVRGRDKAGNLSPWMYGPTIRPGVTQQTSTSISYYKTWSTATSSSYTGGSVKYQSTAGASASYTFSGRSIGYVARHSPGRGQVRIYVDGVLQTTFDLYFSTTTYRYVAYAKTWTTSGTHTIKIVVVGTSGRPRVDLDAFEVIR
jgi:hypothetical protein